MPGEKAEWPGLTNDCFTGLTDLKLVRLRAELLQENAGRYKALAAFIVAELKCRQKAKEPAHA